MGGMEDGGLKRKELCGDDGGEDVFEREVKNKIGDINGSFLLGFFIDLSLLSLFVQTLCVLVFSFLFALILEILVCVKSVFVSGDFHF